VQVLKKNRKSNIPDRGLEDYLRPSELCDSTNPKIKSIAEKITTGAKSPKDAAIRIFYFVRDEIPLAFVNPSTTASETLKNRRGNCFTKATLQMALLRSLKIPARFRILKFRGNDPNEWKGILPSLIVPRMPEEFFHYFVEVYINREWVMADATFDKALLPKIEDWNGEDDVCQVEAPSVLSDMGAFAFIEDEAKKLDEIFRVPVFLSMNAYRFFWILNLYLNMQRLKNRF
jgi:transglutaminase-like putative cysteine protease